MKWQILKSNKPITLFLLYVLLALESKVLAEDVKTTERPSSKISIKQIDLKKGAAVAEVTGGEPPSIAQGSELFATFQDKNCSLLVKAKKDRLIQLDLSACEYKEQLKIGQALEKSLIESSALAETPQTSEQSKAERQPVEPKKSAVRVSLSGGYSFATTLKYDSLTASSGGQSATGNGNYTLESAPTITAEISSMKPNSWGYSAGLTYDFSRKFQSYTINSGGSSATGTYSEPKSSMSFLTVFGNAVYQWDQLYLPFGLNYTSPSLVRSSSATGTFDITGGVGAQIGIGAIIDSHFSVELIDRVLHMTATATSSSANLNFGDIYFSGLEFRLKWAF